MRTMAILLALLAAGLPAPAGENGGSARKPHPKIEALGDNAWVNLGIRVPGGWEIGLAYDQANRFVFKYGGCTAGPLAPGDYGYSNYLWVLDVPSEKWQCRRPVHMYGADKRPINGCGRAFNYDATRKLIWTTNGVSSSNTGGGSGIYSYDGAADKFEGSFGGPHGSCCLLAHDPDNDLIAVVFGGGGVHVFDPKAKTWKAGPKKGPNTGIYHNLIYLPELRQFFIAVWTPTGETADKPDYASMGPTRTVPPPSEPGAKPRVMRMVSWGFDAKTMQWTELKPKHEIQPPRNYWGMVYDSKNKVAILHGGNNAQWSGKPEVECPVNDTWAYDPKENDWKKLEPANAPPAGQNRNASCFDTEHGVMLSVINDGWTPNLWAYRYKK